MAQLWRELYESARIEANRELRFRQIIEAQKAMLEHALFLERTEGSDEECRELEQAADGLQRLRLAYIAD
jgi:hypothetical protein